jgi:cytochrome P450/methylase of polypeptide subunit release factors
MTSMRFGIFIAVQLLFLGTPVVLALVPNGHFHHHGARSTEVPNLSKLTLPFSRRLPSIHLSSTNTGDMYVADTTGLWNETLADDAISTAKVKRRPKPLQFVAGIKYLWEVFRGTVHKYQYRLAQEHGDAFIIWNKYVTLTNADAIRDVLYVYNLEKPADINVGYKAMFFPTGGMLAAPWKEWVQQRRMTAPALSENVVGAMAPKFDEASQPFFEILEEAAQTQKVLEMDYTFSCLTMDTIGLILLGQTFGLLERIRDKRDDSVPFQEALDIMAKHSLDEMVYGFLPQRLNKLLRKTPKKVVWAKETLDAFLDDCIQQRISTGVDSQKDTNLLNILLEAEQEGVVTREELKAQLLLFVFAGYDTTAHTLAFMLYELVSVPGLQEQLFREAKQAFPSRSSFPFDPKVISERLPLLDRVWLETLRLHPSTATGVTRVVGDDPIVVGDGLELPPKTTVSMSTYAFHRNPAYWKNPDTFDPSRWEPDEMKDRDPITLMAFSAGPRNCLGARLARAEALSIMAALLRRFLVTCTETTEPETFQSLTTRPKDGIHFTFQRRKKENALEEILSNVSNRDELHLKRQYAEARQARSLTGHETSVPLYQECLRLNPTDRTAATWIAAEAASPQRHDVLGKGGDLCQRRRFVEYLKSIDFDKDVIAELLFSQNEAQSSRAKASSAPLYLQPLRAGSPPPFLPSSPLEACVQLLLLSCCIPLDLSIRLLGREIVDLMQELGIAFVSSNNGLLIPYCHVMPVTVRNETLYLATDLHPNVLSSTTVDHQADAAKDDNGAVMYIGPDSTGLVDHWCSHQSGTLNDTIVDLGCGSGIQGLAVASLSSGAKVVCVDINKRALRLTKLNFEWNGLDTPKLVQGDIMTSGGRQYFPNSEQVDSTTPWMDLLANATMMVSNPPFLPVPIDDSEISRRHGWFSSGGSSGEEFLESVVSLASTVLDPNRNSSFAIVSEFMNPQDDFGNRLSRWWSNSHSVRALLFTNQNALDADTYARRRADNALEAVRWKGHLDSQGIKSVSPGFLFLKQFPFDAPIQSSPMTYLHIVVPKTAEGSLWTPNNVAGRQFTYDILKDDKFID